MFKISLEAVRVNAKRNQKDWGDLFGVTGATIGNWEKGRTKPPKYIIKQMSDISGIPMEYIDFVERDE